MIPSAGGVCPPYASFYLVRIIKERNKGGRGRGRGTAERDSGEGRGERGEGRGESIEGEGEKIKSLNMDIFRFNIFRKGNKLRTSDKQFLIPIR